MRLRVLTGAAVAVLVFGGLAGAEASRRPRLDLRATPKMSFPPVDVLVVAELKGGDAIEDFYCPGLEWDWGDGSKSAEESDCPPFQQGVKLERFFSARHAYGAPGNYGVKLTMRRAQRTIAVANVDVVVFGGSSSAQY